MESQKKQKSLKFNLLAIAMGIPLALGAVATYTTLQIVHESEESLLQEFEGFGNRLADNISAQFYERYGDVQSFALNPDFQSGNASVMARTLDQYVSLYGIYDLIMVVDAQGNLVATNTRTPEGKDLSTKSLYARNYSQEAWFQAVKKGQFTEDQSKGFTGTYFESAQIDPYVTKTYGEKKMTTSFSAAIRNSRGELVGVITNRTGARWYESAFVDLYSNMKANGHHEANFLLFDREGTVFLEYHPNAHTDTIPPVSHNWETILKRKIDLAKNQAAITAIKQSKTGSALQFSEEFNGDAVVGFTPISGKKFIDSIGWYLVVEDSRDDAMASIDHMKRVFFGVFGVFMAIACSIAFAFSNRLSQRLAQISEKLLDGANNVTSNATQMAASSTELSESVTEQAAAIQQTAASIDEVSSMVKKSSDNAKESKKSSETSRESAEEGQRAAAEMTQAITLIHQSTSAIMKQVETGNDQISEIAKVIAEIGNKTKVINDIVFQTKLLSFNASVEAARAGEHGKGFAVVAEEVGNLAQMSGNAAKEISGMLESSITKVDAIVAETKASVEKLVVESKKSVDTGTQTADRCRVALEKILSSVQEVDHMVSEITIASTEQAQGVSEINKAVNQLDQATQQNASVAQQAASSAENLGSQARTLKQMAEDLTFIVLGNRSDSKEKRVEKKPRASSKPVEFRSAQVIPFKKEPLAAVAPTQVNKKSVSRAVASGRSGAVAAAGSIPSADDPRFEDV